MLLCKIQYVPAVGITQFAAHIASWLVAVTQASPPQYPQFPLLLTYITVKLEDKEPKEREKKNCPGIFQGTKPPASVLNTTVLCKGLAELRRWFLQVQARGD
jgi:hypothetical protein